MQNLAIIITPEALERLIEKKASEIIERKMSQIQLSKDLPERLTCKQAAKLLGISETTFHNQYSALKTHKGNSVFVLSEDLRGYLKKP